MFFSQMEPKNTSGGSPLGDEAIKFPTPSGRSIGSALANEIKIINESTIIDCLLESVHGLMAILNENRQLLAINDNMLLALGVASLKEVLGLRLGKAVHCIHAEHAASGCGTTEYCSTCGAAIAQVIALRDNRPSEQLCAIEIPGDHEHSNIFFRVRASPLKIDEHKYILLFMQDVSQEQRVAALEQVFLHDLRNTTMGISMGTSLLAYSTSGDNAEVARDCPASGRPPRPRDRTTTLSFLIEHPKFPVPAHATFPDPSIRGVATFLSSPPNSFRPHPHFFPAPTRPNHRDQPNYSTPRAL